MEPGRSRIDTLLTPAPSTPEAPDPVTLPSGLSGATGQTGPVAAGSASGRTPHRPAVLTPWPSPAAEGSGAPLARGVLPPQAEHDRLGLTRPAHCATAGR